MLSLGPGWGGSITGSRAELNTVSVRVLDEEVGLPVVADATAFDLVAIFFDYPLGLLQVIHLKGVVYIAGLGRSVGGLNEVHHHSVVQLQPGNSWVVHLTLNLPDAQ